MLKKNITTPTEEPVKTNTVTPEQYLTRLQTVTIPALIRRIADLEATIDRMNQTELNIKRILAASEQLDIVKEDGQNHQGRRDTQSGRCFVLYGVYLYGSRHFSTRFYHEAKTDCILWCK